MAQVYQTYLDKPKHIDREYQTHCLGNVQKMPGVKHNHKLFQATRYLLPVLLLSFIYLLYLFLGLTATIGLQ